MDRHRRRPGPLARAATLALAGTGLLAGGALAGQPPRPGLHATPPTAPPLRAMRWAAPAADPLRAFATQPAECLVLPADPARRRAVEIGRAAFRTPVLLGGQAARAGLSCEACHRSGRDNPDFLFPGASGDPGTADVTLSLFSSHRGNGVHDPKPIPDLAGPRDRLKVAPGDLSTFIHGLITEEFDGPEPPPAVLAGLAAYVTALTPAACPTPAAAGTAPREAVTTAGLVSDARRAAEAARGALAGGDRPTAVLMLAAARARLFLIDERYAGLAPEQARLRAADSALAAIQGTARTPVADPTPALNRWLANDLPALAAALHPREPASLFNPARATAAARRLPANPS